MAYALGVDIGGTKIAAVIINQQGEILYRAEVQSNQIDREEMFKQVVKSVELVLIKSKLRLGDMEGMGVGVPGKVDRVNGIAVFQNNLPWANFPIVKRLRDYFGIENIVVDNDVYMAAYAEWLVSTIKRKDTFVYITISTGISCSIIHDGSFMRGAGFAGEIGLFPVKAKSSPFGIENLEKVASGPAILNLAKTQLNKPGMTTGEYFRDYLQGSVEAQKVMNQVIESLVHGLYSIVCLLDPHKIIFGGGVINHHPYMLDLVKVSLKNYLIPEQHNILERIEVSHFNKNAGIVGAGLKGMETTGHLVNLHQGGVC